MEPADYHQTAADVILGIYRSLLDGPGGRAPGDVLAELGECMEPATDLFTSGAMNTDRQQMIDGFNKLVNISAELQKALAEMGVFLLASVVNATEVRAEEVMRQAVARSKQG